VRSICLILAATALAAQQPQAPAPLNNSQALEMYSRAVQLMEASIVAVPELARAGAPLIENARQALTNLRANPANADLNYTFLINLRAYLVLSDAVPKPFPFLDEAQKQLHELRDVEARAGSNFRALIVRKDQQLRNPDRDNLERFAEANSRVPAAKTDHPRVVFLGDSITDFWRLNEYFPDSDFINRGISGQIAGQMLGRMEPDVVRLQPVAMVVLAGTNDIGRGTPIAAIEDNLMMIADLADYYKIKVILASVLPVSDYHKDVNPGYERTPGRPPATIRALNEWIKSFCAKRNFVYLDYYPEMVDASGYLKADLADDGLHPNAAGYRIMAPLALAAIERVVKTTAVPITKKRRLFGN
jgi:lysophospholipase L1-like esterase